jgi:hypothetical protein
MFCCLKESLSVVKKSKANWSLDARDSKRRVFFWCIYICRNSGIIDRHVGNSVLIGMLNIARTRSCRGSQKCFNHFATGQNGMTMFPLVLGNHRPNRTRQYAFKFIGENWIVPALTGGGPPG